MVFMVYADGFKNHWSSVTWKFDGVYGMRRRFQEPLVVRNMGFDVTFGMRRRLKGACRDDHWSSAVGALTVKIIIYIVGKYIVGKSTLQRKN